MNNQNAQGSLNFDYMNIFFSKNKHSGFLL